MRASEFAKKIPRQSGKFARMGDPIARFWSKVEKRGPEECWGWHGVVKHTGYGEIMIDSVLWQAHRYAYTLTLGAIPEGKVIDHLCRNRGCVNPAHMEPVTRGENTWRGSPHRIKTHCKQGHPFDAENTIQTAKQRICRACQRAAGKRKAERRKQQSPDQRSEK